MRKILLIGVCMVLAGLAALAALAVAGQRSDAARDTRPVAVATTGQVADIVRNIAGDSVRIEQIIHEGVDPHLYRPTRTDIALLMRADIVFYNGLHLEGQMVELLEDLAQTRPSIAVANVADIDENDPHVWMSVPHWIEASKRAEDALIAFMPGQAEHFRRNAHGYRTELKRLDDYVRTSLSSIPEQSRILITAHDAFGYMGRAYNIEVVGIQGISTDSETGLKRIEDIVSMLVERKIAAVFIESSVSERNVRALIEGAAARGHTVKVGGMLYSDALGAAGSYEGTYTGMMDHNATVISQSLGGKAPTGGMQGKLSGMVN